MKEDMKMTYQESVPAQVLAWEYTRQCAKRHVQTKHWDGCARRDLPTLYLGGHSKGGNLAMYAAIRETSLHQQIRKVFNFDGPGFRETFYAHYECSGILSRIVTYLPQGSVIGRLLEHREAAVVIEARESGLSHTMRFAGAWAVMISSLLRA
ncbi:MAG: Mbeg1-like protein [Merdibacter sp.]